MLTFNKKRSDLTPMEHTKITKFSTITQTFWKKKRMF